MAIIDLVTHSFTDQEYAYRFPNTELSTWTQLIVAESQEAVLVKEGRMIGPFRAGRHTLDTANYPFLVNFAKIPFSGKSPFTAEVWFVNRAMPLDVKWGTQDPIQVEDPKYGIMLPVRAFGQYGVQVDHSIKFLQKLVGTMPGFDRNQLTSYFRGLILTRVKAVIAKYIVRDEISVLKLAAHLDQISSLLQEQMKPELDEYGLKLVNFFVNSISTDEADPAVAQLKAALAKRAEMSIIGYTYQQERSFDTLETAAGNTGSVSASFVGAGVGLGLGAGLANSIGPAMTQVSPVLQPGGSSCGKCGTVNPTSAKYCVQCAAALVASANPNIICGVCGGSTAKPAKCCSACGRTLRLCGACGTDNSDAATLCVGCNQPLPAKCAGCGSLAPGGTRFCPNCGKPMIRSCIGCGSDLRELSRFCPKCGKPAEGAPPV